MNHLTRVYDNIFEMLPSEENPSPMVRINRMNPSPSFTLFAKLEWLNLDSTELGDSAFEQLPEATQTQLACRRAVAGLF